MNFQTFKKNKMLFLLLASLFFHTCLHSTSAYEDPRWTICTTATPTYSPNSTFSATLTTALTALQTTAATTGFATTTATNPTTNTSVTALALCRSSISPPDCQTCVAAAALGIRRECPNNTAAQVWYTYCMLRYSPVNFVNQSDTSIAFLIYDTRDAPDESSYDLKVNLLIRNLSYAAGASGNRSAVGRTTLVGSLNIYGYVDCTRDIDRGDCTSCLLTATDWIPSCCLGKWAGWIATPTCNIQFNMDPVHKDWINNPQEIDTDIASPAPEVGLAGDEGGLGGGRGGGKERSVVVGVGVSFAGIVVVVVVVVVIWWRRRVERGKNAEEMEENSMMMSEDMGVRSLLYDLEVLVAATDNFSPANRIGGGGFGSVYRGKILGGEEIAVKKLKAGSTQGIEEFSNEVRLLLKMQHRNLVRLLGCFIQGEEMMLVYEYLPNKSLDYFLFDKSKSALLDWTKRFNIIKGVARGLLYLHEDSQLRIIHRDIKASNILLDERMNPKISDFGLARLFNDDEQSRVRTRRIMGTFGYMAPEYAIRGMVSTKSDVFSFGVFMLETISGRKNFDIKLDDERKQLLNFTMRLEQEGRLMELVDVTLGSFPRNDVLRCIRIGLLCCQESVQDRPTMSSALIMLTDNLVTLPAAGRLGYQDARDNTIIQNADKSRSALLDWTKRFSIINGVARGLLYLHEDSQLRIIHRDIKASNILLDGQMNPKISDFGLARLFSDEQSRVRTRQIMGTFGYMAPEYAIRGVVSTKSDVFSFGVLMLETISGRKNFDIKLDDERKELLNFTMRLEQEGRLMELVDATIGSFPQNDVLRCLRIGLLCCQESVQDRPTMSSVLVMLTDNLVTLLAAGRLGYQDARDNTIILNAGLNPASCTRNSITMSLANGG
ncbi:hypothetical protein RHMOL_Rhmol10G0089300 [Rhododendron molle]|uniref:Uncharacterized protein n=1 Tax=Rhododendron molle TaxID=49168 RepID=A0ACC0M0K6_RHOML|nr:hypothetical protein RHMOL_Rhmol10G0089300 [Rhododendron molle]